MNRLLSHIAPTRFAWLFDGGEGGGTTVTEPPAPTVTEPAAPTGEPAAEPAAGTVSMTQADLDKIIARSHAKGASAAEKKIGDYLSAELLTGEQKVAAERDAAIARADAAAAEALDTKVETAAERAALAAKVDPNRVERFLRLVDLKADDLRADGKADADAIVAAVAKTLTDFPEFATGAPAPAGASGTEHGHEPGKVWTREEIAKIAGTPEFDKNEAEIMRQMQAGLVK